MRARAAVPISLIIAPALPTTIPFWLSRSTTMSAKMRRSVSGPVPFSSNWRRCTVEVNGSFLLDPFEHRLADEFGHEEALALGGRERGVEQRLALRKQPEHSVPEFRQPVAVERRDRHHGRIGVSSRIERGALRQAARNARQVHLVGQQDGWGLGPVQQADDELLAAAWVRVGVEQLEDQVDLRQSVAQRVHHLNVEPVQRPVHSGQVEENGLPALLGEDAGDTVPRRLRLGRDDRHLLTEQRIDERALAGVGAAEQRDRARAPHAAPSPWRRTRTRRSRRLSTSTTSMSRPRQSVFSPARGKWPSCSNTSPATESNPSSPTSTPKRSSSTSTWAAPSTRSVSYTHL